MNLHRRILTFSLLLAACAAQAAPAPFAAIVTRVVDGDTLWLRPAHGGSTVTARALGIDAPESCQAWGSQSTHALRVRVLHQQVQVTPHGHDVHGRLLVALRRDGEDVWAEQVRQGHAWNHVFKGHPGPYAAQEQEARTHRRGLWHAGSAPVRPVEFRKTHLCSAVQSRPHRGSPHAPPAYQMMRAQMAPLA